MVFTGTRLLLAFLLSIYFTAADESIAFSTNFRETTWFSFKMTGRSDKGFQSVSAPAASSGMRVCDVAKVKQPENLLISPFIQPLDSVKKVMIDLKFEVEDSKNKSMSVALVETDSPVDFNQWHNSNFNVVKSRFGDQWVQISEYMELELQDSRRRGFHMALLDRGACIRLLSMQVKYLFCPTLNANLSLFERTTTFVKTIQGKCVEHAIAQSAPENNCKSSGDWRKQKPDPNCQCMKGFEPDTGFQTCQRCIQDYYKPNAGNHQCQRCPANSERLLYSYNHAQVDAVKCECKTNYFRSNNEPIEAACSTVPSKPQGFKVDVKYTTFSLKWNRPDSNGGRTDLYYEVSICPRSTLLCDPETLRGDIRQWESTGYSPEQEYVIKLCAMNGVSGMMRTTSMESRSCQIQTLSTGKELKVRNLELVPEGETIAIQWQKPDVYVSKPDLLNYSVTVLMGRSAFSHVTTSNSRAAFSGLSSGEYTFSVVARYNGMAGPPVNFTQRIQGLGDGDYQVTIFNTPEPGVLLMVGVVAIVLLILITVFVSAVYILRKKHSEWERTIPHHSSLLEYETNKQMPGNYLGYAGLPYDFSTVPVGQTFIDPHYYNLEEMLHEYTQPLDPINIELDMPVEGLFLGSGFFGSPGTCNVADQYPTKHAVFIKMCKQGEPDQLKELFFMEAAILGQFNHPNVLQLVGVALKGEPMMMVTEYTSGSLLDCLVNASFLQKTPAAGGGAKPEGLYWSPSQIIHQMRGVACGMQYLSELGYVHKVLCCKNVLVSENGVCKITGFDQRIMLDQEQFVFGDHGVSADILPWSAPEVYNMRKYSTQSDSWSFGVMLWEIFSFPQDQRPYFNRTNIEIIRMVDGGFRLPLPRNCPLIVYELMKACWDNDRSKRPDFGVIQEQLHLMVRRQDLLNSSPSSMTQQLQDPPNANVTNTLNMKSNLSMTTGSVNTLPRVNSMGGGSSGGGANNYYIMPIPVQDWLHSLKLPQYIEPFTKNSINTTDDVITSIDGPILEQMGVRSNKHRQKILDGIVKLKKGAMINPPPGNTTATIAQSPTMTSSKIYDVKYSALTGAAGNNNFQSSVFSEI